MATNMYIQFEIPALPATGEIEVLSWNHPHADSRAGGSGSSLSFTKYLDAATDELLKANYTGKQFGKATLALYRSDGSHDRPVLYLSVVLEHVIIAKYAVTGGPGEIPVEDVGLEYGTVKYDYKEQGR